jgi:hypothetical protein
MVLSGRSPKISCVEGLVTNATMLTGVGFGKVIGS